MRRVLIKAIAVRKILCGNGRQEPMCYLSAASIHLALGQYRKAELLYRDLIQRNSENYSYLRGLEKAMLLTTPEERLKLYAELAKEYPRSHVIKRMPLLISSGMSYKIDGESTHNAAIEVVLCDL